MDPIAHTLVGGTLAKTALQRATPLATATLLIGANLPDIDGMAQFVGRDFSLGVRRGWTHGVLALAVLPAMLAVGMWLLDAWRRRHRGAERPVARLGPLLGLAYLSVLSHPALDWLNNYGVRLLMPFDGRWFYGDALFIVDPWVWLLAGTSLVLAHSRTLSSAAGWVGLASVMTLLVTTTDWTPPAAKLVWAVGVAAVIGLRVWTPRRAGVSRVATVCLAIVVAYVVANVIGTHIARGQAERWLARQGISGVTDIMAAPLPANPFVRDVVAVTDDGYHFVEIDWFAEDRFRVSHPSVSNGPPGLIVEAALMAPEVQGMRRWLRFPSYEVQAIAGGYRVIIRDLRYSRARQTGIGMAVVDLNRDLTLR